MKVEYVCKSSGVTFGSDEDQILIVFISNLRVFETHSFPRCAYGGRGMRVGKRPASLPCRS